MFLQMFSYCILLEFATRGHGSVFSANLLELRGVTLFNPLCEISDHRKPYKLGLKKQREKNATTTDSCLFFLRIRNRFNECIRFYMMVYII